MLLDYMDYLSGMEADLMRVFSLVVIKNSVLLQVLHLIRMRDDGLNGCGGKGRERERETRDIVLTKSCHVSPTSRFLLMQSQMHTLSKQLVSPRI